jgi:trans-aconitate methyltransferase
VLDVGCGAGTLARRLAARTRHVDALDHSPTMLAAAAAAAAAADAARPTCRGSWGGDQQRQQPSTRTVWSATRTFWPPMRTGSDRISP